MSCTCRWIVALLLLLFIVLGSSPAFGFQQQSEEADIKVRIAILLLASDEVESRNDALSQMLEMKDDRLIGFLEAYNEGSVYVWKDQIVICREFERDNEGTLIGSILDPLTKATIEKDDHAVSVSPDELIEVSPSRKERKAASNAIRQLELWSSNREKRLAAIKRLGDTKSPKFLPMLEELYEQEKNSRVRLKALESILLIKASGSIDNQPVDDRANAIAELGQLRSARAVPLMNEILKGDDESTFHQVSLEALHEISRYQAKVRFVQNIFNGLSAGSILILMALGLSIIFGQMGVINMAHGELMMVGAYTTYEMQLLFGHTPDNPANLFFLVALPMSFVVAASVGMVIERLVVRHLYGRPLESLLATWGVGLILIQAVRVKYGDNIGVNSPSWLVGSFEPINDLVIPFNRAFILSLCLGAIVGVYLLLHRTRFGLLIRATVSGRDTANSLGVNTQKVDGLTFGLGAGLAGVAGCAWTLVGGVTPDMGQNHIVDSFLIVVTGGVGNILGTVLAGLGMGVLNKILEPTTFGGGVFLFGVVMLLASWLSLSVEATKRSKRLGCFCFLFPVVALVFGFQERDKKRNCHLLLLGGLGIASVLLSFFGNQLQNGILSQPIQAIWAKVIILTCVVLFIQWKPLGLFPPRGRLADA